MNILNPHTDIFSATDIGLVRENNEDYFGVAQTPNEIVCIVCDGMGGHNGGEVASRIAVGSIAKYFETQECEDAKLALKNAFDFANQQIINEAKQNLNLRGMGTTACVLLIRGNCVWIAHVGDSRIYLFEARKKRLRRLTSDHSLVQVLVNQGIITEKMAATHPNKNQILKALGIKEDIKADISEKPILPSQNDIFLLCTDGLCSEVSDKAIEKILAKNVTLPEKSNLLMLAAKMTGGRDNITLELVKISYSTNS